MMKKKFGSFTKRCRSVLLAVPIASFGAVTAFAGDGTPKQSDVNTRDTYIIGDANGDGVVSVSDVTTVQKSLAQFDLDFFDETAADVNGGALTINDATDIQKCWSTTADTPLCLFLRTATSTRTPRAHGFPQECRERMFSRNISRIWVR